MCVKGREILSGFLCSFLIPSRSDFHPDVISRLEENGCFNLKQSERNNPKTVSKFAFLCFVSFGMEALFLFNSLQCIIQRARWNCLPVSAKTNEWMYFQKKDLFVLRTQNGAIYPTKTFSSSAPPSSSVGAVGALSRGHRDCSARAERSGAERSGRSLKVIHQNVSRSLDSAAVTTLPR